MDFKLAVERAAGLACTQENMANLLNIDKLPNELLLQIFIRYFSVNDFLDTLRHVNAKWDSLVKLACHLSIRGLTMRTIRPCELKITFDDECVPDEIITLESYFWIQFQKNGLYLLKHCGENLNSLKLIVDKSSFSQDSIVTSLTYCKNLEIIEIVGFSRLNLDSVRKLRQTFPYLKRLKLIEDHQQIYNEESFEFNNDDKDENTTGNWSKALDTVAQLVLWQRDQMKNLEQFYWLFTSLIQNQFAESIMESVVTKSFSTLTSFEMFGMLSSLFDENRFTSILDVLTGMPNLKRLGLGFKFVLALDDEIATNFFVTHDAFGESLWSQIVARSFEKGFKVLKELILKNFVLVSSDLKFTPHLASNLEVLHMSAKPYDTTITDIFAEFNTILPALKKLILIETNLEAAQLAYVVCKFCPNLLYLELRKCQSLNAVDLVGNLHEHLHNCENNKNFLRYGRSATKIPPVLEIVIENFYHYLPSDTNQENLTDFCGVKMTKIPDKNCDVYEMNRFVCTYSS